MLCTKHIVYLRYPMRDSKSAYQSSNNGPLSLLVLTVLVVVGAAAWFQSGSSTTSKPGNAIVVYCAAGMRKPVEEAAIAFQKEFNVEVRLDYGSSGELEGKLELERTSRTPRCDLYIPADLSFAERAREKELTSENIPLARFELVLAAAPDHPSIPQTLSIDSMLKTDIPYGICDEKAGAGKKTREMLSDLNLWEDVQSQARVTFPRVTELAGAIKTSETVHAGFIWDSTAKQFGLSIIKLSELKKNTSDISANVATTSQNPIWALRFARYLAAPEKGAPLFEKHHFTPAGGDAWELQPEVVFYCGGVNRDAIASALNRFQEREGCIIKTQFAGCGTLVGSIQSGRLNLPDAFMTCDTSYMSMVQGDFQQATDVSSTHICMLVRKGNPKAIHTLQDLAKPGIAIGTTDPQMSTLGALSHAIFEDIGIKETIRDQQSIIVTAPTAHELILQMEGHDKLDVALVYEANCQNLESNVETVAIDHPLALATQNIAAARQTRFPALMARLMNEVLSAESKKSFTEHGFHWEAPSSPHP